MGFARRNPSLSPPKRSPHQNASTDAAPNAGGIVLKAIPTSNTFKVLQEANLINPSENLDQISIAQLNGDDPDPPLSHDDYSHDQMNVEALGTPKMLNGHAEGGPPNRINLLPSHAEPGSLNLCSELPSPLSAAHAHPPPSLI
ncbi:hypothetical protein Nepgr_008099 [Nepenthes gracilis]|uniref:Uncharacterized protein n=1 Tax=Nepenthes gracilis TaxID=150966 RepID=A0AAD3S8A2_NEPGR|nr:hypothetical protein Nepgr_008099 [Nepenthes gracilis]